MNERGITSDGPEVDHFTITVSITKTVVTTSGSVRTRRVEQVSNFVGRGRTLDAAKKITTTMLSAVTDLGDIGEE